MAGQGLCPRIECAIWPFESGGSGTDCSQLSVGDSTAPVGIDFHDIHHAGERPMGIECYAY